MDLEEKARQFFNLLWPHLGERERRLVAAAYSLNLGYGGVSLVSRASGLSRVTVTKGIKELDDEPLEPGKIHKPGAGRPTITRSKPHIYSALRDLAEESTKNEPDPPLLWTLKSTRSMARELNKQDCFISHSMIGALLKSDGYSLQSNFRHEKSFQIIDKDSQLRYISSEVKIALESAQPIIAIETKKLKQNGDYDLRGANPPKSKIYRIVNNHDFSIPNVSCAYTYGIYDIANIIGNINIVTFHDNIEFAVNSLKGWWNRTGKNYFHSYDYMVVTGDVGGTNGYTNRLWKFKMQDLANYVNCPVKLLYYPPITSKWNGIQNQLFSFLSTNWRGEPILDYITTVSLISDTKNVDNLSVTCKLDHSKYDVGTKITDSQLKAVSMKPMSFNGKWNTLISPTPL